MEQRILPDLPLSIPALICSCEFSLRFLSPELTSRAEKENFIDLRHGTKAPLLARLVHGTYPVENPILLDCAGKSFLKALILL